MFCVEFVKEWVPKNPKQLFTFADIPHSVEIAFFRHTLLNYLGRLCDFEANLGDICKICDKDGWFFATHSIISSSFVRLLRCSSIQKSNQGITEMTRPKGAFFNYVDQILPNIHHLPIPCQHLWRNSFTFITKICISMIFSVRTTYLPQLVNVVKVHIFWEGHKILRNLHPRFVLCSASQIYSEDFAKFCGLLRIYEL